MQLILNRSRASSNLTHGWTLQRKKSRHRLSSDPPFVNKSKSKNHSRAVTRKNTAMWRRLRTKPTNLVYHFSSHWRSSGGRRSVRTRLVAIWAQTKLWKSLSSKWNSFSKKINNSPKRWSLCRISWLRASMEVALACTLLEVSDPLAACHKILTPWPGPSQCQTLSSNKCNGAPSQINTQMLITLTKWGQNNLLNPSLILIEAMKIESHRRMTTKTSAYLIIISINLQVVIWSC